MHCITKFFSHLPHKLSSLPFFLWPYNTFFSAFITSDLVTNGEPGKRQYVEYLSCCHLSSLDLEESVFLFSSSGLFALVLSLVVEQLVLPAQTLSRAKSRIDRRIS